MQATNSQSRKSIGIALLLAAGLLAVLFVATLSPPAERAGAHDCDPSATPADVHKDFRGSGVACTEDTHDDPHEFTNEVDGGRHRDLVFKAYVPDDAKFYDSEDDQIVITFERSFDLPDTTTLAGRITGSSDLITVDDNGGEDDVAAVNVPTVAVDGKKLILTGGTHAGATSTVQSGEYITITIKAGAGIETPETPWGPDTPRDLDEFQDDKGRAGKGYEVFLTFVNGDDTTKEEKPAVDRNFVVVKNPISSTVPSATVRVELATYAEETISTSDDIAVDFSGPSPDSGFILPSSMATSRIKVFYLDGATEKSFTPSEVQVQGERVIFAVPSDKVNTDIDISFSGNYRIEFSNLARIRNPFSAGIKTIRVSSFVEGDIEDTIEAIVRRTTTVDPQEGARGSEFTLEGKGYAAGTVTIYHDADGDMLIDPGETLDSVTTVRGAFRVTLTARGNPGEAEYKVTTKDSEGVDVSRAFIIRSSMSFEPDPVGHGSSLTIIISDWEEERNEVVAVQIAGQEVFIADAVEYANCIDHPNSARRDPQGRVTLVVDVPSAIPPNAIPPGEQTVAVFDHRQLDYENASGVPINKEACYEIEMSRGQLIGPLKQAIITDDPIALTKATVEIEGRSLNLTPSSAARGQRVTITGSGFTRASRGSNHIESVWIGGERVMDDHSEFEVGTDGSVAFNVTVPLDIADGANEVRVEGSDHTLGQATLTVPGASIALEPTQGRRGTDFTITGSGFIANELVLVTYHSGAVVTTQTTELGSSGLLADSQGRFELDFSVPITAEVGLSHLVTAVAEVDTKTRNDRVVIEAEAEHLVTRVGITTMPDSVSPGDHLTIRGEHLPPFSLVGPIKIAGIPLNTSSEVATDEDGFFETTILVPQIDFRDHTLLVQVAGVIIPHIVEVAPPPLSGTPGQVFRYLIRDGVLSIVWHYDNATQSWLLFDPWLPGELFELNDLTEVGSGDIVWINLRESQLFQGSILPAGWNLISLK